MNLDSRERALISELKESLASSLELPVVLARAQGWMFELVSADHAAWCVSRPGRFSEYEWVMTDRLAAFLARYPEMAGDDFVRGSVVHQPNVVLRDSQMAPREVLTRSRSYQLCRELDTPLEHVMSVRLDMRQDWHGGLTVYREQRMEFSEREQARLQSVTPVLARTVRNCRMFSGVATHGPLPEALLQQQRMECLVLTPKGKEVLRTARVTSLLRDWFSPSELGSSGLPREWVEWLLWLVRLADAGESGSDIWERHRGDQTLRVTFVRMPDRDGRRLWTLVLDAIQYAIPVPASWSPPLTPREMEVASYVLQNHDDESIAAQLEISQKTAKTHVKNIFRKLRPVNRAELIYRAALKYMAARD
ncbi:helix-turn-helix transcriptional regulator [Archangium violaceum]|uniref:response regulator transcription factor n=1 Tax=Archangium violaceum TaxID=83451 RepID=UPI00194DDC19|nr:helix-turn-helix transcriptional regulator [Archangium violaceum]QRN95695.1 helix-turn-helix transcriptional regulator [Archangium violaceum]